MKREVFWYVFDSRNRVNMERVFGTSYLVNRVSRMHGGAQKVVYKMECSNGFSCVLYVWDLSMNYFEEEKANEDINE
ncbi:hypothetical protein PAECIP111894_04523 [Paenibacillus pseudetheri]|uniref:Uncharacterized protein n=1 Tax=Paenibacillus pseudetheri TaxID=2897682 RepID=A0ABN8FPC9_9BACL|nr:hypothetical protein [Paenibacillus pseudetheri]CAH1058349.1 hypothetical protein PAECIP111894_04523 [Paenibacillus pseudetheri]